ncbi:site-specific DNA-methyltransferase [Serratia inhibens]|uniref:site-specific DNA-methyltransferase (adenine-specific) n=1 Tax=Serratia inhibens TaxID=2338073 RepID=A0AA93BXV4_9GAMM|nr:site-specific DNA-methyltransferase [Serratia inhibens]RJF58458.1 site-specific DNA-methyltransferase [Serratia inhibens]
MATGVSKNEKSSKDSLLAGSVKSEIFELPENNEVISINYKNKITKEQLLKKQALDFVHLDNVQSAVEIKNIPENTILLADNFFGLKKLITNYENSVKLIYLDPPYGTGFDFQSRELKHAYKDVMGLAPWLEFMRRRLILMRELLTDDGSIYVHIGHQMLFHLKLVMDEVFGQDNFRNMIVRKKCSSKNYTKKQYPNINDYILFYGKSKNTHFKNPGMPADKEWMSKEYNKKDDKGSFKLVPIHAPGVRNGETGMPWKGMLPPAGKHWQMLPSKLDILDSKGEIHWSKNGNPRRKVYLPEDKKLPLTDYWDQFRDAHHQSIPITGYPTEKNFDMLKKIIEASTNEGDLVLDPFSGSGTTIHAAHELKRQWIGIDQSFLAIETSIKRLQNGLNPMGDFVNKKIEQPSLFSDHNSEECLSKRPYINYNLIVDKDVYDHHKDEIEYLFSLKK